MNSSRLAEILLLVAAVAVVGPGCAKDSQEKTILQSEDLSTGPDQGQFDPSEVIDPASFTDDEQLDAQQLQDFLHRTPYKRASFLETYESNGVRAVDALVLASRIYKSNPA